MRLLLLLGEDKRRLHCFTLWPATMLLKRIPTVDSFGILYGFIKVRELSAPVRNADMKMASESSAKVLLWP